MIAAARPVEVAVFERFTAAYRHLLGRDADEEPTFSSDAEHEAVLELLVATMFANGTVSEDELREIDQLVAEHDWGSPTFSFSQSFGSAVAEVRDALDRPEGLTSLLAPLSDRITTPGLRAEVHDACAMVAHSDGTTDQAESTWLDQVRATFGT